MQHVKKLLILIISPLLIVSCGDDDTSDEFWKAINVSGSVNSAVFVLSSSENPTCENHGQAQLEKLLANQYEGIEGTKITGLMLYPSLLDPMYNTVSEELKFLFDQNGDGTFQTYPSFVNDVKCYGIDSTAWLNSIKISQDKTSPISLGGKRTESNGVQTIYIRGIYNQSYYSNHSVAVYLYRKNYGGTQASLSGGKVSFIHKNVVFSGASNTYGKVLSSAAASEEFHEKFELSLNGAPEEEVGIAALVYKLEDGKPKEVVNSIVF